MPNIPPAPGVDPTSTIRWMTPVNESGLSSTEKVILNNLRLLSCQQQHMAETLESILDRLAALVKKKSVAGSGAATSQAGDHTPSVTSNTTVSAAVTALKGEWADTLLDRYRQFVTSNKKKVYKTRIVSASTDANEFATHIKDAFEGEDQNHPILDHLELLNADLNLDLYAFLGRKMEDGDNPKSKEAASSRSGTSAGNMKGQGRKRTDPPQETTREVTGDEQDPMVILDSHHDSPPIVRPRRLTANILRGLKRKKLLSEDDASSQSSNLSANALRQLKRARFTESTYGGSSPPQPDGDQDTDGE